jgi:hypothetical protein
MGKALRQNPPQLNDSTGIVRIHKIVPALKYNCFLWRRKTDYQIGSLCNSSMDKYCPRQRHFEKIDRREFGEFLARGDARPSALLILRAAGV